MVPDPFGAEQTYLTEDDIKQARKGSMDMQDEGADDDMQIDTGRFDKAVKNSQLNAENLDKLFAEKMTIDVLGQEKKMDESSENKSISSDDE